MSNVINLAHYRRLTRKAYLAKYGARLSLFIDRFVHQHLDVDFRQLAEDFQAGHHAGMTAAWDYVAFREVLAEALDAAFGKVIYEQLARQPWFDVRMITQDEVIDRCISAYIMGRCANATQV